MTAPRLRVVEVRLHERDVRYRMPFRFGAVTLSAAPQAFVRLRVQAEGGREAWGMAAELMAPKWFDKNPALSNDDNIEQLRTALRIAAGLYTGAGTQTAFGLYAGTYPAQVADGAASGLNPLTASFGPALLDKAVLDAVCRLQDISVFQAIRDNAPGFAPADLAPGLAGFDVTGMLAGSAPRPRIQARHTVGLTDPLTAADLDAAGSVGDGLPETLEQVIAAYGHRYFKIKVGGDVTVDVARLVAIAAVLDGTADYRVSLDGNEQYDDIAGALALWEALCAQPSLRRFRESVLYVEQPINRAAALTRDVRALAAHRPMLIDESDSEIGSFPAARALGYTGVSAKSCKGLYKSLINAARCMQWNAEDGGGKFFITGEDLSCQAGLAVQQDLALASLLGLGHVERNGHHYVNGLAGTPAAEQHGLLAAHGDLYRMVDGRVCLRIENGEIALGSLDCPGFATACYPDTRSMRDLGAAHLGQGQGDLHG